MAHNSPEPEASVPDRSVPVVLPGAPVLEVLFERAPEIITITDADGHQLMVNAAGLRLLGFDDSYRTPADGMLFVHPDDRELLVAHRAMFNEREARGESFDGAPALRYRVRAATGKWRWLEMVVADMSDVPEVGGRVAFSRDVTESEERAQALLESRARLLALVASLPCGAFIEDGAGQVLLVNEQLTDLFPGDQPVAALVGRRRHELVAQLAPAMLDPTALDALPERLSRAGHVEAKVALRSGLELHVEVVQIRDGDADFGRLWRFTDATARRDEQRRQAALLELEHQARQAAEQQAERLEAFDQMRNDFVAGVSHDLRTPLTAIASASELLLSDPILPEGARDHLAIIHRNADRLRVMVEDLLLVGRLHAGVLTLEASEVRIAPLLRDAAMAFDPAAERRSVTIDVDAPDDLRVVADARRLSQIAENLIENAVKYTAPDTDVVVAAEREGRIDASHRHPSTTSEPTGRAGVRRV